MKKLVAQHFAKTLFQVRGVSQLKIFAQKIGVSETYLCLLESGHRTPSKNFMEKLKGSLKPEEYERLEAARMQDIKENSETLEKELNDYEK